MQNLHKIKALFVISTPAQVATFDAVLQRHRVGVDPDVDPLFLSLERFYSYDETHDTLVAIGWPSATLGGTQDYTSLFENPGRKRIKAVVDARRAVTTLIRDFSPAVIVLGNDIGAIEKVIIDTARKHRVPTLLVQDGILSESSAEDYGPQPHSIQGYFSLWYKYITRWVLDRAGIISMPNKYGGGGCDRIAAMGPYSREVLICKGTPPEHIVVTGQPRFDELVRLSQLPLPGQLDNLCNKRTILFASYWMSSAFRFVSREADLFVMNRLSEVADALCETHQILIRPHPHDNPQDYVMALERLGQDKIRVVSEGSLWGHIRCCDLVITYSSTVGIEAVALGKPLVTLSPISGIESIPYSQHGVAIFAGNGDSLLRSVEEALFDQDFRKRFSESRQSFLEYNLGAFDGNAGLRVLDLVILMADH
jgi:hypothetical protein